MIQVEHVTKKYGSYFTAVDDLSFQIHKGEIVGFVGQNGAGKTTTLKMLTNVLKPTSGTIRINGYDIEKQTLKAKESIAYVADNPDMFLRLSGLEFIHLMADIYHVPAGSRTARITEMAERFEIADALTHPMSDYSHGMRQKMMVCAALIHNPPVWILDEPMTGLDPKAAYELKNMMREHAAEGNCVFFSTHVLEVAEQLCDKIIIIRGGKSVFIGTLDELRAEYPDMTLESIFLKINGEYDALLHNDGHADSNGYEYDKNYKDSNIDNNDVDDGDIDDAFLDELDAKNHNNEDDDDQEEE